MPSTERPETANLTENSKSAAPNKQGEATPSVARVAETQWQRFEGMHYIGPEDLRRLSPSQLSYLQKEAATLERSLEKGMASDGVADAGRWWVVLLTMMDCNSWY